VYETALATPGLYHARVKGKVAVKAHGFQTDPLPAAAPSRIPLSSFDWATLATVATDERAGRLFKSGHLKSLSLV
jgi:hypothetical protein